jgi:hypothetical protein
MRSLENLLQVNLGLTTWEFRNVLASLYSENPPKPRDPPTPGAIITELFPPAVEPPPEVFPWQGRREIRNSSNVLGSRWDINAMNIILKKIGLEFFTLYSDKDISAEFDAEAWQDRRRPDRKYALVDYDYNDRSGGHIFSIANGWIVDSSLERSDYIPITRFGGTQDIVDQFHGAITFTQATIVTGPTKKDPPYTRLDYDLDALRKILRERKGIDPKFEGFSQQHPVDLTEDDKVKK